MHTRNHGFFLPLFAIGFFSTYTSLVLAETELRQQMLPISAFADLPHARQVKLSPNGRYVALVKNMGGVSVVMSIDLIEEKPHYVFKADGEDYQIRWLEWANNDVLLASVIFATRKLSHRFKETSLFAFNGHKEGKPVELGKIKGLREGKYTQFRDQVISLLPDDEQHILMQIDDEVHATPNVYRVDIRNDKRYPVKKHDSYVRDWMVDRQARIRVGFAYDYDALAGYIKLYDLQKMEWVNIWPYETFEDMPVRPIGFGLDPNHLYVRAEHEGRQAVYLVKLDEEGYPMQLIASDKRYDIGGGLIYSSKTKDVAGLYYQDGSARTLFWDEEYKVLQAGINNALKDTANYLVAMSNDANKYLLYSESARAPGAYYLGERATKRLVLLAEEYPQLHQGNLMPKEILVYKARDGLQVEGFFTHAAFKPQDRPAPLILLPHGGPMARDHGGFDYWAAFFSNRGYNVFQPNFRGSAGYGFEFMMQAIGQYGEAMQDDLEDAVKFLVARDLAEKDKVCIVGASYGGYAALLATVKTPDLFQCAISFAGISDLKMARDAHWRFLHGKLAKKQYGKDNAQLERVSAINGVEKINTPILLIHGDEDQVVSSEQSEKMAKALKKQKKVYEYIALENGDHFLSLQRHRHETFAAMEKFLTEHLPVAQ